VVFVTPSSYARVGAFGLLNKPLTTHEVDRALKKAQYLFSRDKIDRARWSICHTLSLDVVFSQRLIKVPHWNHKKYKNSMLRKTMWEVSPVWKTAPSTAYRRAARLSVLFGTVSKFGVFANVSHDLVRLATLCWVLSSKDFSGLCRRIESRCGSIASLTGDKNYLPETAPRRALSALPKLQDLENVARSHLRGYNYLKYGVSHRPSSLGGALLLLSVKKRIK